MLVCPECGASHKYGAIFCGHCGEPLYADNYATQVHARSVPDQTKPGVRPGSEPIVPVGQVLFHISGSKRQITINLDDEIRIGRSDPNMEVQPQLDLTDDDGLSLGVSRLHASLHRTENGVMLVDLGSTNGTYLNRYTLAPNKLYRVENGDIIHLGKLKIQVLFEM